MKLIILAVAVVSLSLSACSQDIPAAKVPSVAQNAVQTKFSNAVNIEWEKKKTGLYEAEFAINSTEYTAWLDATGKLVAYKLDIKENELPATITSAITREHAGYRIDDADKIEKDGITYYQVELDAKGKKDRNLVFSADGKMAPAVPYMH